MSRWINPLPDIALHTLQVVEETPWPTSVSSSPGRDLILKSRRLHKRAALNVGGVRHEVTWRLLDQFPQSRLGRLARVESHQQIMELVSYYDLRSNEFFFDRSVSQSANRSMYNNSVFRPEGTQDHSTPS